MAEWRTDGCGGRREPERVESVTGALLVTPADLATVLARVESAGRAQFPDSFAGLEVNQAEVLGIVYRVPSPDFDAFLRAEGAAVCLEVRDAAYDLRTLLTLQERIVADLGHWRTAGIEIGVVGCRHDGTGVEVSTRQVAQAQDQLPRRYGPEVPIFVRDEAPPRPLIGS
ncbi:hypothetical protein [Catenuloplanes atrovinosus]|uniref:Uncharacterized protein n=1 Tax=Catenuloplanes atrovinosus TaxID=137266 RepID=A0AAE4CDG1_9ACTN|nr:hypothetical protein [Catenuloplanes atrovinosus]MDR7280586.1 hypothetical protein [Catenuloplanes atrovinosus]